MNEIIGVFLKIIFSFSLFIMIMVIIVYTVEIISKMTTNLKIQKIDKQIKEQEKLLKIEEDKLNTIKMLQKNLSDKLKY